MKRTVTSVGATLGILCALLLTTSRAHAQQQYEFGQRGEFIISADRLVPFLAFSHESATEQTGPGQTKVVTTQSQSSLSLLYSFTADANDLFYTVPRVGFDYVVVPNLTIGGDLVLFFTLGGSTGGETDFTNGTSTTTSVTAPKNTLFGIAPRVGYIFALNNTFSFWLRGGLSFYTLSQKTTENANANGNGVDVTTTNSVHQFSLDLDPQFVITPIPHLGFTAGITADLPFAGGHSSETDTGSTSQTFSASASVLYLGVTLGMIGYF
jgi:hypothetical protein